MHVITKGCCNEATCVTVCPVNCIHPTPDEPEFAMAEMLYIDPDTCIDCGACLDVCPVDAVRSEAGLTPADLPFVQLNADYYKSHDVTGGLPVPEPRIDWPAEQELRVAIVGTGPAAQYTAQSLEQRVPAAIDMFDRLHVPFGLVRSGVAPDHMSTKNVSVGFAAGPRSTGRRYFLGVEVGAHLDPSELADRYHAVVYAHGALQDRSLGIPGEDLEESVAASRFVHWYGGEPEALDAPIDLGADRIVLIGNGNVALDIARILLTDVDDLARTDISDHALDALRTSKVREVVLMARRGVAQAAYTIGEFLALGELPGVDVHIDASELSLDPWTEQALTDGTLNSVSKLKIETARRYAEGVKAIGNKRIVLRYLVSPAEFRTSARGQGTLSVRVNRNRYVSGHGRDARVEATGEVFEMEAGAVIRAAGFTGASLPGLPFDADRGVVPNVGGRVLTSPDGEVVPGAYVAGWIKRGATGGIGVNKVCGEETARALIQDALAQKLPSPLKPTDDVAVLAESRGARVVDADGWTRIDHTERAAGASAGRPRVKLVSTSELVAAASPAVER